MGDDYTDVSTEGWGSRLIGSFVGALVGLVLLPLSVVLLYWNEGRAVEAQQALSQGAKQLVEIDAGHVDSGANGKLVYVNGALTLVAAAKDPVFGVTGDNVVRLQRKVEMYQWKETEESHSHESVGGSKTTEKTYHYDRVWSTVPIHSSSFKHAAGHENPEMPIQSETFNSDSAKLGAYKLDSAVLEKLSDFQPFTPGQSAAAPSGYRQEGGGYFHGAGSSGAPEVGDVKVSFATITTQTISVVAGLAGDTLAEFHGAHDYVIVLAKPGTVSAGELFKAKTQEENNMSWIWRGVGFVAMLIGFSLAARPLSMILAFLPFLEGIAEAGAFLVALILTLPLTLLTIAIAWIAHRPVLGVALLVASGVLFWLLNKMRAKPGARMG
jgi:hypothetical protein